MEIVVKRVVPDPQFTPQFDGRDARIVVADGFEFSDLRLVRKEALEFVGLRMHGIQAGCYRVNHSAPPHVFDGAEELRQYDYLLLGGILVRGTNLNIRTIYVGDGADKQYTMTEEGTLGCTRGHCVRVRSSYFHLISWQSSAGAGVIGNQLVVYHMSDGLPSDVAMVCLGRVREFIKHTLVTLRGTQRKGHDSRLAVYLSHIGNMALLNPGLNTNDLGPTALKTEYCFSQYDMNTVQTEFLNGYSTRNEGIYLSNILTTGIKFGDAETNLIVHPQRVLELDDEIYQNEEFRVAVTLQEYLDWLTVGAPPTIKVHGRSVPSTWIKRTI